MCQEPCKYLDVLPVFVYKSWFVRANTMIHTVLYITQSCGCANYTFQNISLCKYHMFLLFILSHRKIVQKLFK